MNANSGAALLGKRTYSSRRGRFSSAQRHAYEQLYQRYCIPFVRRPLQLNSYFAEPQRNLIVELGSGMGDATADLAAHWSNANHIAVEVHPPGIGKLLGHIECRGLTNLRIIAHDAIEVVAFMLPPLRVSALHLFFPDPWPKNRHHKRRLVQAGFAELVTPVLAEGAYICIATDWQDYAESMLELLGNARELVNCYNGFAPPQEWRPQTAFERKGMREGRRIYEIYFARRAFRQTPNYS